MINLQWLNLKSDNELITLAIIIHCTNSGNFKHVSSRKTEPLTVSVNKVKYRNFLRRVINFGVKWILI